VGQELKVKEHKFALSFNDPKENAGTTLSANYFMGGKQHQETLNELSGWLNDTANKEWKEQVEKECAGKDEILKTFFQIKISTSNAAEKIAKF